MPKVSEIIEALKEYNPDAEMHVVVNCQREAFSITYGSSEGVTMETADSVSFYVDRLNQGETEG